MNLAQPLNSFEKKLHSFTFLEKIELYVIPILVAAFIIYNFIDFTKQAPASSVTVLKRSSIDSYAFLKQLQAFAQKQSLTLLNIKQNGLKFTLQMEGDFSDIMQFILFCEHYESVNTLYDFKLTSHNGNVALWIDFELASNMYEAHEYEELLTLLSRLQNPFQQQLSTHNETLKINAIVNDEVLINDVWLKRGDAVLAYIVFEIHQHFVILEKPNGEQHVLHLMKE